MSQRKTLDKRPHCTSNTNISLDVWMSGCSYKFCFIIFASGPSNLPSILILSFHLYMCFSTGFAIALLYLFSLQKLNIFDPYFLFESFLGIRCKTQNEKLKNKRLISVFSLRAKF